VNVVGLLATAAAADLEPRFLLQGRVAAVQGDTAVVADPKARTVRAVSLTTGLVAWTVDVARSEVVPEVAVLGQSVFVPGLEDSVRYFGYGKRSHGDVARGGFLSAAGGACTWTGEGEARAVDCTSGEVLDHPLPGPVPLSDDCGRAQHDWTAPVGRFGDLHVVKSDERAGTLVALDGAGVVWSRRVGGLDTVAVGEVCVTSRRPAPGFAMLTAVGCLDGVPRWSVASPPLPDFHAIGDHVLTRDTGGVTARDPVDGHVVWTRALSAAAAVWFTGPPDRRTARQAWREEAAEVLAVVDPATGEGPDLSFPPGTRLQRKGGGQLLLRPVRDGVDVWLDPAEAPTRLALPVGWWDGRPLPLLPHTDGSPVVAWDGDLVWVSRPTGVLAVLDPATGWQGTFPPGWYFPVTNAPFFPDSASAFANERSFVLVQLQELQGRTRRSELGVFDRG
jgi:hypothetical protein